MTEYTGNKKSTIIHKGSDKPKAKKARYYIDPVKFYNALLERREARDRGEEPQITNYIGSCFMLIAEKLGTKASFSRYTYKDDMIGDAYLHCIRYVDSFDPYKSKSAFSYFTQTCYYMFLGRIRAERKHQYIKYKASSEFIALGALADDEAGDVSNNIEMFDVMNDFINTYEEKNNLTTNVKDAKDKKRVAKIKKSKSNLENILF